MLGKCSFNSCYDNIIVVIVITIGLFIIINLCLYAYMIMITYKQEKPQLDKWYNDQFKKVSGMCSNLPVYRGK